MERKVVEHVGWMVLFFFFSSSIALGGKVLGAIVSVSVSVVPMSNVI
jgi:hypothetical protein